MAYTSLITYFSNLNNFEKIIKRLSIHIHLLHKILNLSFIIKNLFIYLNKKHFNSKILQDKLLCI